MENWLFPPGFKEFFPNLGLGGPSKNPFPISIKGLSLVGYPVVDSFPTRPNLILCGSHFGALYVVPFFGPLVWLSAAPVTGFSSPPFPVFTLVLEEKAGF